MSTNWGQVKVQSSNVKGAPRIQFTTKWGFPRVDTLTAKGFPVVEVKSVWGVPRYFLAVTQADPVIPTFPTKGILDNFNRIENPLSTNWLLISDDYYNLRADGSDALPENIYGQNGSYWTLGPLLDCEAYATITAIGINNTWAGVWARVQGFGLVSTTLSGYLALVFNVGPVLNLYRKVAGSGFGAPVLSIPYTPQVGYKLGIKVSGTNPVEVEVFTNEGSGWNSILTYSDSDPSRISTPGYIGCQIYSDDTPTYKLDDFGGG